MVYDICQMITKYHQCDLRDAKKVIQLVAALKTRLPPRHSTTHNNAEWLQQVEEEAAWPSGDCYQGVAAKTGCISCDGGQTVAIWPRLSGHRPLHVSQLLDSLAHFLNYPG